ncbi:MAG: thioredoxin [Christensenellales bacterium]|jgi:thioredoxin 1
MANIMTLTQKNFKEKVEGSKVPVLVDFWAEWCGPCRMISPYVDELAEEFEGKLAVGKINVDDEQSLAVSYGVMTIPTLMVFVDGEVADKFIGANPSGLRAMVEKQVAPKEEAGEA